MRVALAGAGMVSAHHLQAWTRVPQAQVVGIADPDAARAAARGREFGVTATFDDTARMLDALRPDALDIAAGHGAHAALCALAADRGIAILCQKPLGPTLAEARAIVAHVGDRVRLMVHENWRFRPWYQVAAQWIANGAIGAPRHLRLSARSSGLVAHEGVLPAFARQPMLATLPRLMIAEVLVHHLDVAAMLAGDLHVTAAHVVHAVPAVRGESAARIDLAGTGVTAAVDGDFADAESGPGVVDMLHVEGDLGALTLDNDMLRVTGVAPREQRFDLAAGYQASYDAAIAHFATALVTDAPFATPPAAHLRVLAQMEEAYTRAAAP